MGARVSEHKTLEQLADDAVLRLNEAMNEGVYHLPSGKDLTLSTQDMTKIIQDLSRRKGKVYKSVSKPEDFQLRTTTRERPDERSGTDPAQ